MSMYDLLLKLMEALQPVGAKSLAIGIEEGISAADTPFIRLVPASHESGEYDRQDFAFEVYVGTDIKPTLEETYEAHMAFLDAIKAALHLQAFGGGVCYFERALYDKDTVPNFKAAMAAYVVRDIPS